MNIAISEHQLRVAIVAPNQRIDAFSAPQFRAELDALLATDAYHIVVDLSGVPFLDSAGMAVLVSGLKRARMLGGDVVLVWPTEEAAQRILRLTKFDRVFTMADSAAAAVRAF